MEHEAFELVPLVEPSPVDIESAYLWGSTLCLGGHDGSLRIYQQGGAAPDASAKAPLFELVSTRIGFAKKAIVQMEIILGRELAADTS